MPYIHTSQVAGFPLLLWGRRRFRNSCGIVDSVPLSYLWRDTGASLWQGCVCVVGVGGFGGLWCVCRLPAKADAMICCLHLGPDHKLDKNFNSNTCWSCIFFYFLLNFSYRNFMENWDQWGQKEIDGKHPTLQRGEAGQHGAFWTLMTRAELRTLILNWIDYCPVKEEVFGSRRSVETHTTQMPAWAEGNLFSSVLSCRERGQGTSAYTKLQEMLFLSETSERSRKWNT